MSGGHFEYRQHYIKDIIESLESVKGKVDRKEEYYHYDDKDRLIKEINNALFYLDRAYVYTQRLDYLVSCDDGEDNFYIRLREDLNKLKERN